MSTSRLVLGLALAASLGAACNRKASEEASGGAAPSASAPKVIRPEDLPEGLRVPTTWPIPTGPRLAILAGQGLGPIRLGATVATIERLMNAPCEIKTEDMCRYIGRATEFVLKDGATVEIRTHRPDRPTTPKPRVFGVFNGRTPEGVAFLMLQPAVKDIIGPPLSVEEVTTPNDQNTVAIHRYDGLVVEFDKLPNGNVVVGGLTVVKSTSPKGAPSAKPPLRK
ncbi:MAG TPA: hypothetical protein VHE30_15750 [Polyangiaceae bacterium]|nr:hypothetical protein [Polyangiaceae bacterium]